MNSGKPFRPPVDRRFLILCLCLCAGCAKQGYPPGGPADTGGPQALEVCPALESTQVSPNLRPWIRLNEYPQRNSLDGAVFISPQPDGDFTVRSKGKRLEIRFEKPLPLNRTIIITFGTKITDLHGNPMPNPVTLAFSTGDKIDRAAIAGQLTGLDTPSATWVWAYPLDTAPDSTDSTSYPDPRRQRAPYAAQPDVEGFYRLSFLPPGQFRIFTVTDSRHNRFWDPDLESLALPPADVWAREDTIPTVNLRLSLFDLNPPELISAIALHRQDAHLKFTESVIITESVITAQNQDGQTLAIIDRYQNPVDSSLVILITAIQRGTDTYHVQLEGVLDRSGNLADSLAASFAASVEADTIGPRLVWSRPTQGDAEIDPRHPLEFAFSEAMIRTDLPRAVQLTDSTAEPISGQWDYPSPVLSQFSPATPLRGGTIYNLTIQSDSLRDVFSNRSTDSVITINFNTADLNEFGAISGVVQNYYPNLRVVAERLAKTGGAWETSVNQKGEWLLKEMPPANYRLWLYLDKNRDQRYSTGRLEPLTFSEPFITNADTIRVRARWETENVELRWSSP